MMWKKLSSLVLAAALAISCTACGSKAASEQTITAEPGLSQMKAICELSVMDCYYHNVAKYQKEGTSGFWIFKKDKHFWIEYSGVVQMGIDASQVNLSIKDDTVTITLPPATVLSSKVDSATLTKDSYIVDQDSAPITVEDEMEAFQDAQQNMVSSAEADHALLNEAQQRAQLLLSDYVNNIGQMVGKQYTIEWVYLDANGAPTGQTATTETEAVSSGQAA